METIKKEEKIKKTNELEETKNNKQDDSKKSFTKEEYEKIEKEINKLKKEIDFIKDKEPREARSPYPLRFGGLVCGTIGAISLFIFIVPILILIWSIAIKSWKAFLIFLSSAFILFIPLILIVVGSIWFTISVLMYYVYQ